LSGDRESTRTAGPIVDMRAGLMVFSAHRGRRALTLI